MCVLHLSTIVADHAHLTHCMVFFAQVLSLGACFRSFTCDNRITL